ncbi:MAG TPA: hypothetical protein VG722_05045, partial [Tepidisphaeraceae bacterium]|nr:hypothetical protein [Tepidisphaeraceae bacterium]
MENHKAIAGIILGITVAFGFSTALADTVDITANVNGAPSPAQKVYIYFSNTPPLGTPPLPNINGLQGYAGQINWNDASDNGGVDTGSPGNLLQYLPASFYDSTHSFSTYCIDITEDILINHSYTFDGLTTDLASTPVIAGTSFTMGASAATAIQ